jgi:hypothetical protein
LKFKIMLQAAKALQRLPARHVEPDKPHAHFLWPQSHCFRPRPRASAAPRHGWDRELGSVLGSRWRLRLAGMHASTCLPSNVGIL